MKQSNQQQHLLLDIDTIRESFKELNSVLANLNRRIDMMWDIFDKRLQSLEKDLNE